MDFGCQILTISSPFVYFSFLLNLLSLFRKQLNCPIPDEVNTKFVDMRKTERLTVDDSNMRLILWA